eukprot:GHVH01008026.1.p1 GENE.GHVH01008026.1~~GHVH01008026.1.p1  ORF type:complete len:416 (+),score=70.11 GHVH01008026.1:1115-2362(+)
MDAASLRCPSPDGISVSGVVVAEDNSFDSVPDQPPPIEELSAVDETPPPLPYYTSTPHSQNTQDPCFNNLPSCPSLFFYSSNDPQFLTPPSVDPPGFPGIPLDTEVEPLGENGTANGNRSDCPAVGSPDGSNGLTATFDQSHLAYWPPMNHQIQGSFEWNDKMMHSSPTAWSAHSPYPGFFMPSQIRSTPSGQMSAGGLMAYRNSFGHSNDVFFPSSPAAANGAGTMDMNVSNLMMMAGQDTNNNNSNDYHSEQFSPWRNLNSLPNCQPMSNDSSGGVVQFGEKESLSGVAVDLQGKRSQCDDDNSMIDLPSTPPPMTSCPTDDNRGYNIIGSGGQATGPSKSMGSVCHPHDCRPCAFYWTKGCINGHDCRFCHEWHPPKKKKPMKEQKNLMIIARPDGKIEFMRCTVHEAMRVL